MHKMYVVPLSSCCCNLFKCIKYPIWFYACSGIVHSTVYPAESTTNMSSNISVFSSKNTANSAKHSLSQYRSLSNMKSRQFRHRNIMRILNKNYFPYSLNANSNGFEHTHSKWDKNKGKRHRHTHHRDLIIFDSAAFVVFGDADKYDIHSVCSLARTLFSAANLKANYKVEQEQKVTSIILAVLKDYQKHTPEYSQLVGFLAYAWQVASHIANTFIIFIRCDHLSATSYKVNVWSHSRSHHS